MSVEQVRKTEEIANQMINKSSDIYAKEAPLAVAKSIQVSSRVAPDIRPFLYPVSFAG